MSGNNTQLSSPPVVLLNQYTIGFEANALGCILWGIYVTIAGANLSLLHEKRFRILLAFTLFQLIVSTLYLIVSLYAEPGALLALFGLYSDNGLDQLFSWSALVSDGAFLVNTLASDAFLVLYRCYVVCMDRKTTVIFPALIYIATFGASIAWLVVDSAPGSVYSTQDVQIVGTTAFSCSVAMNMSTSLIITARLSLYRRTISQVVGAEHGRFYHNYLAMTLESAALYTVFVIITLVMFTTNSPLLNLFFPVLGNVQVIAPSLIIYRIARGISFGTDGYGKSTMSTANFASETLRAGSSVHRVPDAFKAAEVSSGGSTDSNRGGAAHWHSSTYEFQVDQV